MAGACAPAQNQRNPRKPADLVADGAVALPLALRLRGRKTFLWCGYALGAGKGRGRRLALGWQSSFSPQSPLGSAQPPPRRFSVAADASPRQSA